ncbi:MAG: hydrogenase maturation nickel metallochaperone HypA [Phycisphaerae bacterium]|nr:hydrogenase maturation nickel metallochaperone HypA [Phycisphaerae bacterium]
MTRKRTRLISTGSVIAWLATGAVLTVAVAWGCALWSSPAASEVVFVEEDGAWLRGVPADWPVSPSFVKRQSARGFIQEFQHHPVGDGYFVRHFDQYAWLAGWPMLALTGAANKVNDSAGGVFAAPGTLELVAAIEISFDPWMDRGNRVIPLLPIPIGFVVDTLFWGAIVAGATLLLRAFKRRCRIARGRCPGCGYELVGALRCPECGDQRAPVVGALAPAER